REAARPECVPVATGRPPPARALEAEPDLDTLGGLDAHEGMREPPVELAVPLGMAPEPGREPDHERLDDATQRIALGLALVDERDDATLGLRIGHAHRGFLGARGDLLGGETGMPGGEAADLRHVAEHADVEGSEQALGETAHGHPGRRLARARALEDVPHVVMVVLERPGEVGVTGARSGDRERRVAVLGPGRHLLLPVPPVTILDPERDRRAERLAPAHAGPDLDLVALDLHATAATVTLHPPGEIPVDRRDVDRNAGPEPLHHRGEAGAV